MPETELNQDGLVLSRDYLRTMNHQVLPFLRRHRQDMTVNGKDGKPLFVSRFDAEDSHGTVVIIHGFTENLEKYSELIYSLLCNGRSVLTYDQRGHGRSWRDERIQDISLTHVEHFEDYTEDLEIICREVLTAMPAPWDLLCHSMGGAVGVMYLERHGDVFRRAVLGSPMIAPNLGGMPSLMVKLMCRTAIQRGNGRGRVFISKAYDGGERFENSNATGPERFEWYEELRRKTPAFQNNGPTYGWTMEAIQVTEKLMAPGAVEKIRIPVRVFAAEKDHSVMQKDQEKFVARLKDGSRKVVAGSRHEIYRSSDEALFPWWHEVLGFLKDEEIVSAKENQ